MELIFATNNRHKVDEMQKAIGNAFSVITLEDAGINVEIPEPFNSLEENADEKARVIHEMTGSNCFSEDTGLEIEALNGEPGVHSARYAGEDRDMKKNIEKVLVNLGPFKNRKAQFRTVISLILNGKKERFEGVCKGTIISVPRGNRGFGYDPIFVPDGANRTFAEMDREEKNSFSHRARAADKLVSFLQNI